MPRNLGWPGSQAIVHGHVPTGETAISQPKLRSTVQRRGDSGKPLFVVGNLTISSLIPCFSATSAAVSPA